MSGLPQGYAFVPDGPSAAWLVSPGTTRIGRVWWRTYGYAAGVIHAAGPATPTREGFRTTEQAARWILLQRRPVVWQVRQHRRGRQFLGWDILDHRGTLFAPMGTGEEQRLLALTIAEAEAARLGRLRGNV